MTGKQTFNLTESDIDGIVAHYGVKGQKWGVTRSKNSKRAAGGARPPNSDDAKTAYSHQQRAKAHGTGVLSNKELQELVTRVNLETQYSRMSGAKKGAGQSYAAKLIKDQGKQQVNQIVSTAFSKGVKAGLPYALGIFGKAIR